MPQADPFGPDFTCVQVANAIATCIRAGESHHEVLACRDMAWEYAVAYQTARRSLRLLQDRSPVLIRSGGTFFACPVLPEGRPAETREPLTCDLGGLTALAHMELTAASRHMARCRACQLEFVRCGGLLPRPAKGDS